MNQSSLLEVMMQITDGHPADAADAARRQADNERLPAAEQIVRIALLRRARENALRTRLFGDPCGSDA